MHKPEDKQPMNIQYSGFVAVAKMEHVSKSELLLVHEWK